MRCKLVCPLHGRAVQGTGPSDPVITFIGEAPGKDEEVYGVPFVGKSGQELDMYLRRFTRVARDRCYIDNIVRCQPPKGKSGSNRDPSAEEIAVCTEAYLIPTLIRLAPGIVASVGRVSTSWFMRRPVTMERVHGIPVWCEGPAGRFILVPVYHPAYGLHSPRQMKVVLEDFTELGRVVRGQSRPRKGAELELDYRLGAGHEHNRH